MIEVMETIKMMTLTSLVQKDQWKDDSNFDNMSQTQDLVLAFVF